MVVHGLQHLKVLVSLDYLVAMETGNRKMALWLTDSI